MRIVRDARNLSIGMMLYAPYATNKEYGGSPAIIFEGQPDAFIVAPTGVAATGHKHGAVQR